jgi:hypothetical protein
MVGRGMAVIELRETIMILDLHQHGLTVSAIPETGIDRKTVRNTSNGVSRFQPMVPGSCVRR